jgi:ribonuclease D
MKPNLPDPHIVDTVADVAALKEAVSGINRIAVDTESNSLYAYQEQVCLIQITIPAGDFIVDPLRLDISGTVSFLGDILADPSVETIFHAAEYDVMCIRRDFGFEINNLFDTMVAASILGWERIGLGSILEDRYNVDVDKSMQRANWGKRPLTRRELHYAQIDTHYLFDLRDDLHAQLASGGHLEEARELFDEVTHADWGDDSFDEEGFWNITGARKLNRQHVAVLRRLYIARENIAYQQDQPVFKVLGDKTLVRIAKSQPRNFSELGRIRGVSGRIIDWYGNDILEAIQQGRRDPAPERPKPSPRPDDEVLARYDALHTWRKERAKKRGVSSEIVMAKDALWQMAHNPPRTMADLEAIESIGPWRRKTYGPEVLGLLSNL